MPAGKNNNRGRIGKASTRGAANGISIRGASSRGGPRGRGRPPLGPRTRARELLPHLVSKRGPQPADQEPEIPEPVKTLRNIQPRPVQESQLVVEVETPAPKVERIYNDIWESGPASLAFVTHGNLDHTEDTIIIALNILDHIIRPENWNPELSNNKLSASCFFFACKLTGQTVTAKQVAESVWVHPSMVAAMAQAEEGPLFDRMLESLTVSAEQVVQGYEILYNQRKSLRELLGSYGDKIAHLPSPAMEKELIVLDSEEEMSAVAVEMMKMGYKRGSGSSASGMINADLEEARDSEVLEEAVEVQQIASPEEGSKEEGEGECNNDFEDFVAENE